MTCSHRIAQTASALSLAMVVTLAVLGSLNHLATEQHAATVLARAASPQQAQGGALAVAERS